MKLFILSLFIIFQHTLVFGQFHYRITSEPDSSKVLINGKEIGHTPLLAKYYWRQQKNNQIIFSIQADGYKTWTDTIKSKPRKFDKYATVKLKRIYPSFKFDSSNTILAAYDKLMPTFDQHKILGNLHSPDGTTEQIQWNSVNRTSNKAYEYKFYEILNNSGIPTPVNPINSLFSNEKSRKNTLPRYIIGTQIIDYKTEAKRLKKDKLSAGRIVSVSFVKMEWKVYDKAIDKVVLSYTNEKKIRLRGTSLGNNTLQLFEELLIDFLNTGALSELMINAKNDQVKEIMPDTSSTSSIQIKQISNPTFKNISEMVKYTSQSCVTIITDGGHGSGVIIDPQGYILTAYHVVEGINKIRIKMENGIELDANIIAYNTPTDLALLRIHGGGFRALPFSKENSINIGEEVLTIGTPADLDLGQSISRGMISGKRSIENNIYIQLDIAVSPGNSGGPLINQQGEIIGIIQKKIVGKGVEGIGFAIPSQKIKEIFGLVFVE